jgi:hypothetical protein
MLEQFTELPAASFCAICRDGRDVPELSPVEHDLVVDVVVDVFVVWTAAPPPNTGARRRRVPARCCEWLRRVVTLEVGSRGFGHCPINRWDLRPR